MLHKQMRKTYKLELRKNKREGKEWLFDEDYFEELLDIDAFDFLAAGGFG